MDNSAKNSDDDYPLWQIFVHSNQVDSQAIWGYDVEAIIGSVYPSFISGGRNCAGILLVNFDF